MRRRRGAHHELEKLEELKRRVALGLAALGVGLAEVDLGEDGDYARLVRVRVRVWVWV